VRCLRLELRLPQALCHRDGIIAYRLLFLAPFPHRQAFKDDHMRRVSHHSTRPDRKPERPALSVGGSPEDAVSSCLQGARIGRLTALSRRPGKSALMRPKASAIQIDQARYCTPIKVPNRALVRDGKRRVNPGDVVHSSGPPSMFSSPGTGLLPPPNQ
jgi:hypothetical protein